MNTNSQDKAVVRNLSTRHQLIETAVRVFSSNGFHRTSLDLIALEAGVSKMTIFYHFKNKEDLVIAALDEAHHTCMTQIREYAITRSTDAKSYISAVFGALEQLSEAGELPNLYMRASAEFTEDDSAVRQVISTHVRSVEMRFASLAIEARFQDPHDVVRQLMTILRAVYATQICPAGGIGSMNAKKIGRLCDSSFASLCSLSSRRKLATSCSLLKVAEGLPSPVEALLFFSQMSGFRAQLTIIA